MSDYEKKYNDLVELIRIAYGAEPSSFSAEEIILLMNHDLAYLRGKLEVLEKK